MRKLKYETGRSMVEMLGTLAIIGVLSVGAIAGYSYGMDKYRANQTVNDVNLRAVDLIAQIGRNGDLSLSEWPEKSTVGYDIGLEIESDEVTGGIFVNRVKQSVCEMVFESLIQKATIKIGATEYIEKTDNVCGEENDMVFYYDDVMLDNDTETGEIVCGEGFYAQGENCVEVPVITANSPQEFNNDLEVGISYTLKIQATVEPELDLSYSLSGPAGSSISADGLITYTPTQDQIGEGEMTVAISAEHAETVTVKIPYTVIALDGCFSNDMCGPNEYCSSAQASAMERFPTGTRGTCVKLETVALNGLLDEVRSLYGGAFDAPYPEKGTYYIVYPSDHHPATGNEESVGAMAILGLLEITPPEFSYWDAEWACQAVGKKLIELTDLMPYQESCWGHWSNVTDLGVTWLSLYSSTAKSIWITDRECAGDVNKSETNAPVGSCSSTSLGVDFDSKDKTSTSPVYCKD